MTPHEALRLCKKYGEPTEENNIIHEFIETTKALVRLGWPPEHTRLWWKWAYALSPWHGDGLTRGPEWDLHCALVRLELGFRHVPGQIEAGCFEGFNNRFTKRKIVIPPTPENIQALHDLSDALGIKENKYSRK